MASSPVILETKLVRPPVRAEHVPRRKLLERLENGATRKVTLVAAPPGFGKTTLLAEWAGADQKRKVAWVSLDADDNDPARFFAYVVAALRSVEPGIGRRALAAHGAPGAGLVDVVLPLFLNDLSALDREIALVLDDYHLITNAEIHEAVAYLVEHMPESLHLVLATREDPALPLARLRARRQLAELRANELRFSDVETVAFLNQVLDLDLPAQALERLQARTEGWPAALCLAALHLRGQDDPSSLIDAFAGNDRHLVDFLTAEVLARQPPKVRSFLLRTSILERLSGPLCDALTEGSGSAQLLEELERSNLLLIPLDTKREWYRYHQLFAELLRLELTITDADIIPLLHRRAGVWYRQAGLIVEAARHATAAGDVDEAVELVGRFWPLFLERGQLATVERWLDALPEAVVAGNRLLCLAHVVVAAHTNRLDQAERWLDAAEHAPPLAPDDQLLERRVGAERAFLRLCRGDVGGSIEAARRALASAPPAHHDWATQLVLGAALWWSGEPAEARTVLEHATRTAETARLDPATVCGLGYRAAIACDEGDDAGSEALARAAIELTHRAELEEHPLTAMARVVHGMARTRAGDLDEAKDEVERGIQLAERDHSWLITVYGRLALAEIHHRAHEPAEARRLLTRARATLETLPDPGAGLARVEHVERALRLRSTRDRAGPSAPYWELSDRELGVLRLLAGRLSQREIAAELYVSFNTVKSHTRSIFRKLGVTSRAEAVDRARKLGLL